MLDKLLLHTNLLDSLCLLVSVGLLACIVDVMRLDHLFLRRRLEAESMSRRLWAHGLADASFDGLLIHQQGVALMMNRALVRMLGVREREFLGQNFCTLAREDEVAALRNELEAPGPEPARFRLLRPGKAEIIVETSSQSIEFEGRPATVTAVRNVTQRLADAARIDRLMHHDALTGLPNRVHFEQIMERALAAGELHRSISLLITDIEGFKTVNHQFGRKIGDALLCQLGQRMAGHLLHDDVLARLSGDKFAMLLKAHGPPSRGMSLGGQLLASCGEPFIIDGRLVTLKLSAGLALFPDHAADPEGLIRAAEVALVRAQTEGSGLHLFRHGDVAPARPALPARPAAAAVAAAPVASAHAAVSVATAAVPFLRDDLRGAMGRGEIRLVYHPAFNLHDLTLHGFEASMRWQHPGQGLLRPDQVTAAAEQDDLAEELGSYLIERACTEAAASSAPRLSLNISPAHFRNVNLPIRLAAILRKTGLAPGALEVAVTESMLAEQADYAGGTLQALWETGVTIALDDFGTGAAPLNILCNLPLARLKIGQRFVAKLGQDRNADAMLAAIVSVAGSLQLQITALGVENELQLDRLRALGCHVVQGPLLGEPASRAVARPVNFQSASLNAS